MRSLHIGHKPQTIAGLICTTNLVLSLGFCFLIFPRLSEATSGIDPDGYGDAGRIWWETGRFDSIQKAPLYPAFVALVSSFSRGYFPAVIQAVQSLLSALSCLLLYAIFRRTLDGDGGLAATAGFACALYPLSIWYTARMWTEVFLTLVIALFTLSLISFLQNPSFFKSLVCGFLAGAAALSKGVALIFFPLLLIVLLFRFRRAALKWLLPASAGALLLIAPWVWRTWQLTGAIIPIHIDGGYNFYLGNGFARHWLDSPFSYPQLKALTLMDMQVLEEELGGFPSDPVQFDRVLMQAGLRELAINPLLAVRKGMLQSLTFWYLAADFQKSMLTGILQFPLVVMAGIGVLRAARQGRRLQSSVFVLLVPIFGVWSVCVGVFAFARLSIPVMPYVIGLGVYGIWPLAQRLVKELDARVRGAPWRQARKIIT